MSDQRDMAELLRGFAHKRFVGSDHREKIGALLKHFQEEGLTLMDCTDKRRLNRALSTLQGYARELQIAFPDYTPRSMRPRKDDDRPEPA